MRLGDSPTDYIMVATPPSPPVDSAEQSGEEFSLWDGDGFDFGDILDAINPLQHIPVVSSIYRDITGDEIGPLPRVAGGALFGGVFGAIASLVNVIVEDATGKDIGEHAIAMVFGEDGLPLDFGDTAVAAKEDMPPAASNPAPEVAQANAKEAEPSKIYIVPPVDPVTQFLAKMRGKAAEPQSTAHIIHDNSVYLRQSAQSDAGLADSPERISADMKAALHLYELSMFERDFGASYVMVHD